MSSGGRERIERRVREVAESALAEQRYVSAIDVLVGLGWLPAPRLDEWRQGRVDHLERVTQANLRKISTAMAAFRRWARERELKPSETDYVSRTRDRRRLRFSKSGKPEIERAYRTHWVSPQLSQQKRARLSERQSRPPDLVMISPLNDWECTGCGGGGGLLTMEEAGPVCMACAEMDHLVFLPSGDAALTRRAKKASRLSAVVVRFARARKRYERQGILVEEEALVAAEAECFADEDARARRRGREAERRAAQDGELREKMAREIGRLFPGCPTERAEEIARHAAARGSGRVGRSAAGRTLEPPTIELAVVASIRHRDTAYDELLMAGVERADARERIAADVDRVLEEWRQSSG